MQRHPPASPRPAVSDGIPAEARRNSASFGQSFVACALGAVVLALLASRGLPSWAERLEFDGLAEFFGPKVAQYDEALSRIGLTLPYDELRRTARWLIAREWALDPAPVHDERIARRP
ncbi:MAG TPA: hypothetical protein VJ487_09810 [Alphaproteobacteria bacterium]|nr:hypothetical protein [Alphaproteobacteria bacterium]